MLAVQDPLHVSCSVSSPWEPDFTADSRCPSQCDGDKVITNPLLVFFYPSLDCYLTLAFSRWCEGTSEVGEIDSSEKLRNLERIVAHCYGRYLSDYEIQEVAASLSKSQSHAMSNPQGLPDRASAEAQTHQVAQGGQECQEDGPGDDTGQ
jgi:hypothetical protein